MSNKISAQKVRGLIRHNNIPYASRSNDYHRSYGAEVAGDSTYASTISVSYSSEDYSTERDQLVAIFHILQDAGIACTYAFNRDGFGRGIEIPKDGSDPDKLYNAKTAEEFLSLFEKKIQEQAVRRAEEAASKQEQARQREERSAALAAKAREMNPTVKWTLYEGDENQGIGMAMLNGNGEWSTDIVTHHLLFSWEKTERYSYGEKMVYEMHIEDLFLELHHKELRSENCSTSVTANTIEEGLLTFIAKLYAKV